ncbi:hypothetical protein FPANT_4010 [Fusarium pseudoanthophilum]|uniref:Uncharacterized protein n=1 Tax=Fusarium pseudoanthophilum TaxID=48495 RepID=A0A8H5UUC3_9HYPO|nr:hypothetical protein FPANT_4010 [Fusarium pseudoanthophilum]
MPNSATTKARLAKATATCAGLHGWQYAVQVPQQRAVGLGEELGGAGGTKDVDESHRGGAKGHKELAEDVGADASDVGAGAEDQHPPDTATLDLVNTDLRRVPDEREHDALRERKQRAVHTPRRLLHDGEADVPLGPRRAFEDADDADESVADDDGEHGLPDVELKSDG